MSTRPVDLRSLILALVLALGTLAACSADEPAPADPDGTVDAARGIARTLQRQARAVSESDRDAFLRTMRQGDTALVTERTTYFDNLQQLPVAHLTYRLLDRTVTRKGGGYWAEVVTSLRLQGYDDAPVTTQDRWRFVPGPGGRYLLASTAHADWEAGRGPQHEVWTLGPVEVREGAGVLGVFDDGSVQHSDTVLDSVGQARSDVAATLEGGPAPAVLVYVLTDSDLVGSVTGLGPEGSDLDAATITVPADATDPGGPAAAYRVLLNPRVLSQPRSVLDRLVRHEVTHVALGGRGDGAPLWLTEGIAEYVSVRPLAPGERRLPAGALDLAGAVDGLPPDEVFAGADADAWYSVGWWICEYVAATYGDDTLWQLLDELDAGGDPDRVLSEMLGLAPDQLAARGAELMQRTYG